MRDSQGALDGLLIESWHLWEKKTGIPVMLTATNWQKAQAMLQNDEADVIDTIFMMPEREKIYDFASSYANIPVNIYTHVSIGGIHQPASLRGFVIGAKADDACVGQLARVGITTLKVYADYQTLIRAAKAGQVRIFCMDAPAASYLLLHADAENDFRQAFTLYTGQLSRAVKKGRTALLAEVEHGFKAIDGRELAALDDKWSGTPLPAILSQSMRYALTGTLAIIVVLGGLLLLLRHLVNQRTKALQRTQANLQATLDALPDLLFEFDADGRHIDCRLPRHNWLPLSPAAFLGKTVYELNPPEVAEQIMSAIREADERDYSSIKEYQRTFPGNRTFWIALSVAKKRLANSPPCYIALARDITAQKVSEQQRARITQIYAALSQCNQAIVRCRNEEELFATICRDAVHFGGFKMAWIGRVDPVKERIVPVARDGEGTDYLDGIVISTRADSPYGQGPTGHAVRDNRPYWCDDFLNDTMTAAWHERGRRYGWSTSAALPLTCDGQVVGVFTLYSNQFEAFDEDMKKLLIEMAGDISFALQNFAHERSRRESIATIEHLANYDPLTELPNRVLLRDRVQQAVATAHREGQALALLFVDLDHFKNINDSLGHNVGDQLLRQVAERLLKVVREQDTISRWGGDEFILLLTDCSAEGATRVAEMLLTEFAAPFTVDHHELNTTLSIGIALYPTDGKDFDALMQAADAAMYRAKQEGRNTFRFFTSALQAHSQRFLALESGLRTALKNNEFFLHYQPQFAMDDGRLTGAEALVRWRHPTLGLISPAEFIVIAELSGQILPLGAWVMRHAIRQLKAWHDEGLPLLSIAVNLSAAQFRQNNLVQQVTAMLSESGLASEHLELELTESLAMEDPQTAIAAIDALQNAGIAIAIDDFGTGYSSLSYLKRFRISKIKIDQSFVRDIANDPSDRAIANAVITMAHSLGYKTIAEGVETAEQLAFLREHGCQAAQGYYFSKPLPADEFKAFVQAYKPRNA
jgi:diguanylate cyclase (GGDEF)-like protein